MSSERSFMREFRVTVTPSEYRRLGELYAALRTACAMNANPDSWLICPEFESGFRSKLLIHHSFMGSPLFQESFDAAFISACREAKYVVEPAPPGQRFWDVNVNGRRISLKSSKAKSLREKTLHISKLTEAAWIQDCRTAKKRRDETRRLFTDYCKQVDAIIQLRYFRKTFKYELVELTSTVFLQVLDVGLRHFSGDGPTIKIPIGQQPPDFTLKIDRSDAKITIAAINKALCVVHGTWELPGDAHA